MMFSVLRQSFCSDLTKLLKQITVKKAESITEKIIILKPEDLLLKSTGINTINTTTAGKKNLRAFLISKNGIICIIRKGINNNGII